jgi:hypothetical protein
LPLASFSPFQNGWYNGKRKGGNGTPGLPIFPPTSNICKNSKQKYRKRNERPENESEVNNADIKERRDGGGSRKTDQKITPKDQHSEGQQWIHLHSHRARLRGHTKN